MSGSTTTQQAQTQQSQTAPWSAAQPMLSSILGQLGQAPLGATTGQTAATNQIVNAAGQTPSYAPQGEAAVSNLFNTSTAPQQNILSSAYGQTQGALSPMLSADYTNPYTNPALSSALSTMGNDITNQINSSFAGAGRPAGTNADSAQALARGLAQGEGGLLANEYNTLTGNQLAAAGQLQSAAGNTASGLTTQQQVPLQNQLQGIQAAGSIPGLITQPGMTQLAAANVQAGLPIANVQAVEGLTNPIAALGSQSTGTMAGTTSQQSPWWTTALGAGLGAAALLSDERVKDDIRPVGMLYDGQNVYSYRYKGDSTPRIGLLAQEVEAYHPHAVREFGGIKAVDYGAATHHARSIGGMLSDGGL